MYELNKPYPLSDGFSLVYFKSLSEERKKITIVKLIKDEGECDRMVVKGGITDANFTHEQVVEQFQQMIDEVLIMPVLSKGSGSAYHFDIDALFDGLKMEIDNLPEDELLETEFRVSFKKVSGKKLYELPEFDGF